MKKLISLFIFSCLIFLGTAGIHPVSAADIRSGQEVTIPATATNLKDLYLFGGKILVDAPVTNDVVAAGGDITVSKQITGSVIIAGGNLKVSGPVGATVRAAGGKIWIDAPIANDLVLSGGDIKVSNKALTGGDAVINGGNVLLEGPVKGKAVLNGGEITINTTINGNVSGNVGKLTLGPKAVINGSLSYKSQEKADIAESAVVKGKTSYTELKDPDREEKQFFAAGAVYKLITDIILSVLFIFFFARALIAVIARMTVKPVESGAIGLAFLIFFPVLAFILLILIWLGAAAFLTYAFVLLISLFIVKIFLGWFIMRLWENRNKKTYILNWKAGVIGPLVLFLLAAIPVIGWLIAALLFFTATGAMIVELFRLMSGQKVVPQRAIARKK